MKLLVAGCGRVARLWLEILSGRDDCRVVGLIDSHLPAAQRLAEEYSFEPTMCGYDLAAELDARQPDLLLDLTPPNNRGDVARLAFERGIGVFAEKPFAASQAEAEQLIELGQRHRLFHAVMLNRRYIPELLAVKRHLARGLLGKCHGCHVDFFAGPRFTGFRREQPHVLLSDMALHHFDMMRFATGQEMLWVQCYEWAPRSSYYAGGSSVVATFGTAENGLFTYRGSWDTPAQPTSWQGVWRIDCDQGTLSWDGEGAAVREGFEHREGDLKTHRAELPAHALPSGLGGHAACVDSALAAFSSGENAPTSAIEAWASHEMVFAAIRSAEVGARVRLKSADRW